MTDTAYGDNPVFNGSLTVLGVRLPNTHVGELRILTRKKLVLL